MAHNTVSGKSASQAVVPPVIALTELDAQAAVWQQIWQSDLHAPPSFVVEETNLNASQVSRIFSLHGCERSGRWWWYDSASLL